MAMIDTVDVFLAYAQPDELLRNALEKHLSMLMRQGLITSWHNQKILPGQEWEPETILHLSTADIILLLLSPDFLASDYSYGVELKHAMERHQRGEATVIPVILRPVDWKHHSLGKLRVLPSDGRPVTSWPNQDEGFLSVAEGIREVVKKMGETAVLSVTNKEAKDFQTIGQDGRSIRPIQQALKPNDQQRSSPGKYHIQIDEGKGTVIGDRTQVTQTFSEK